MGAELAISQVDVIRSERAMVTFVNMENAESKEFSINPRELRKQVAVNYRDPEPLMRAPSGPAQYRNTSPKEYTIRTWADRELFPEFDMADWEAFIDSLCYPRVVAGNVIAGPPSVLFVWPGILAMSCKVTRVGTRYDEFDQGLHPKSLEMDLVLKEDGTTMRFSDTERERIIITEGLG